MSAFSYMRTEQQKKKRLMKLQTKVCKLITAQHKFTEALLMLKAQLELMPGSDLDGDYQQKDYGDMIAEMERGNCMHDLVYSAQELSRKIQELEA